MRPTYKNKIGERIGYLKILKLSDNPKVYSNGKKRLQLDYKCDCGNVGSFPTTEYWKRKRNKIKTSCGCNRGDYRTTMLLNKSGFNTCFDCKETKPISEFGKNKWVKNGLQRSCRSCKSERDKKYRNDPRFRDKILNRKRKEYQEKRNNPKEWELYLVRQREIRDYKNEYQQIQNNPFRKSKDAIRKLLYSSFKVRNIKKSKLCMKSEEILGCDFEFFKTHIESKFKKGMSWKNHGKWHLDHKVPLDMATTIEELVKLNHWRNFQPLWEEENLKKSNKLLDKHIELYKSLI